MNFIKSCFVCLLAGVLFLAVSCQKDVKIPTDALAYVPASSAMVTAINLQNLMQKADFEAVKKMEFYQEMLSEVSGPDPELNRILMNPEASGIDLEKGMYLANDVNKDNPEQMTTYLLFSLKNAGDFNQLFKDQSTTVTEKNGIKMAGNGEGAQLGWNDNLAVFAFGNNTETSLEEQIIQIFKAEPAKGAAANADLVKALNSKHDITSWMSTDQLSENDAAGMALNLIDIDPDALKGNAIHSYGDFENGRMTGHAEFFINKKLGDDFIGRFFKKGVKSDFSSVLPGEGLAFAAAGAMNLRGIDQFLSERPQSREYADFVLNDLGVKRTELIEVFGGDMMVAAYRSAGEKTGGDPKMLIAADLKSKKKAQELLDLAEKQGKLKKIEPGYYKVVSIGGEDFSITRSKGMGRILMTGDHLVFSNNDALLETIKSGKFEKAAKKTLQNEANQTFAIWMNAGTMSSMFGGSQETWLNEMRFNVNGKGADFILETSEPGENSLHTMFKMMNESFKKKNLDTGEERAL